MIGTVALAFVAMLFVAAYLADRHAGLCGHRRTTR